MTDQRKRVLIVDDEAGIRDSLRLLLSSSFEVKTAEDGSQALGIVESFVPDLVLLDVTMPTMGGIDTLRELKNRSLPAPVIMLTAASTVKTAVEAMKLGAVDYINKPFDVGELTEIILATLQNGNGSIPSGELDLEKAVGEDKEREAASASTVKETKAGDFGPLVGRAAPMSDLFAKVQQVAGRDATVLVTGESGTGKELIARQIHSLSLRAKGPFVAINCAAIPETLIESELFGHEKGAFTHAVERRIGHFELAAGGTLFLDEIGELSLAVQVKLLRFIQEREFFRIGRGKPLQVDLRIIAATNRQLEELVKEGKFRQDLYYRIHVVNLTVPPLRDRFEDIPVLAQHFIDRFGPTYGNRSLSFTDEAMKVLVEYGWPGNVRELENLIESLLALAPNDLVSADDLPKKLKVKGNFESMKNKVFEGNLNFEDAEKAFESEMIVKALRKTNYVQTRAAELLGISRRILKYKMDKLGISEKPIEATPVEEQTEASPVSEEETRTS